MEYIKRLKAPSKDNAYYFKDNVFFNSGYGMPNCTCYAYGRIYELLKAKPKLPTSNAENWYQDTTYKKGSTPKLGSIICFKQGEYHNPKDGAGHVAVVEEIKSDGTIITSNSGYKSTYFYLQTLKPPYKLTDYELEGFIYPLEDNVDVIYQVYDNNLKKWLSSITNYNNSDTKGYAGVIGHSIGGIRIKLSNNDDILIRAHLKGKDWLSWVNKWDDTNNGYAGIKGIDIDGIQIKSNKNIINYRVHLKNNKWLSWIKKADDTNSGYAGIYGKSIDAIQVFIE